MSLAVPGQGAHGPQLPDLFRIFRPAEDLPRYDIILAKEVPSPAHELLVHDQHMTVTVEAYHSDLVNVLILEKVHIGDVYARKILLRLQKTGKVVLFGIVRVNLGYLPVSARDEILAGNKPFGRILIEHDVLRRIEPTAYLRISPGAVMMGWFGMRQPGPVYGRLAIIHCDDQPAVELLEVVAPE